jgi:hypothetical protein
MSNMDDFSEEEKEYVNRFLELMIELGAIEISGYDSKIDSFTYTITPKMKELIPEFFEEHMKFINQIAFDLWNQGYVEIKFEDEGPLVMLKEDIDYPAILDGLKDEERMFLENMLNYDNGGII